MSEQKYDVFQVVDMIGTERFQGVFTKSDLSKMMDGALYKSADYCEFMELPPDWVMNDKIDKWLCEWINPLIELVPVEGSE